MDASLEGLMGRSFKGTYVLHLPNLIESEGATVSLHTLEVPKANVLMWERL
jgi:hypothetical protein